jgi:isoleucyl-tRNA synthetase
MDMPKNPTSENKTIPQLEDEIIKFWKENKIFEKSVEKNKSDNLYVFYDGPPFISGLPHYGHLLGSIAKDLIPRYWTMKGKKVERVWGWDAHGLPVESKVQQKLGIKSRKEIEAFGLEKFTEECYQYTSEISAEWEWYVDKIGRWVDFKNAYKTSDQKYMESVLWSFKQLYDKGFIYEGIRTSLYCTTCGTPVSNFEIAMDNSYKEVEDYSITVKFPVVTEGKYKDVNLLAWTTTPWTIPSNRGLVLDKDEIYVLVQNAEEKFILAKKRLETIFINKEYRVLEEFKGNVLVGLSYKAPYDFFKANESDFKVYAYEGMVTMEDGTGIVHSAPGFGEIDTEMGNHFGLTLMLTLDDEGKFIQGNNGNNPYLGMYYAKANKEILADLEKRNILFENTKTNHRVPFHDRCDTLLIQKAQKSWFIKISAVKDKLIENNTKINWVPEHMKEGRFKLGIEQAPDWCISRSRFWATPMPVWQAEDGDKIIISSIKELEELSGMKVKDLHRPYIDEIEIKKDGKTYKRISEVLDCWMESGSMPYARYHYPFENKDKFENNFPGDYVSEYVAQVRAWFYVMHVLSTMIFDSNSFNNVIVSGVMAGSDGRKMSKTYNNYTDPKQVLEAIGGDALRLYLMGSPLMLAENSNFDDEALKTKLRGTLNPLWNSLKYFLIYANQYQWNSDKITDSEDILDKWITIRLDQTVKEISDSIESYTIPPAVRSIEIFVDDLSRWYVRRSRERISQGDIAAISTLYTVLLTFSKACAPVIPFMSEGIYLSLKPFMDEKAEESVHLTNYPTFDLEITKDKGNISDHMNIVRELSSTVLALRTEKGVGVRQPLNSVAVTIEKNVPPIFEAILKDEVNVKHLEFVQTLDQKPTFIKDEKAIVAVDFNLTEDLKSEGKARDLIREIQDLRKKQGFSISDKIKVVVPGNDENRAVVLKLGEEIKKKVLAEDIVFGSVTSITKI